jgi:hypothetical protein
VVPFGLFKKKANDKATFEEPAIVPASETLTVKEAQDLLDGLESQRVKHLCTRLGHTKNTIDQSMENINNLAIEMEHEKIKFEDLEHRVKSVVENSKKTVISSLKREASLQLAQPQSINDCKKFKERFENMMKRFGEVSGSHSRVLNAFMKKYSYKMKDEFEDLTKLLNETRTTMSDFDKDRAPIIKCNNVLNIAMQKIFSVKSTEASAQVLERGLEKSQRELHTLEFEISRMKATREFHEASVSEEKLADAEKKQKQFDAQIGELFSHLARAFTKYSYGVSKQKESQLQRISEEPWKIFHENDVSPYSLLLFEIKQSIDSGNIQLKDSEKVHQYLETIVESMPEFQAKSHALVAEIDTLKKLDTSLAIKVKQLDQNASQVRENLERTKKDLDQQRRLAKERHQEVDGLLSEASDILVDLTGRRYSIKYS